MAPDSVLPPVGREFFGRLALTLWSFCDSTQKRIRTIESEDVVEGEASRFDVSRLQARRVKSLLPIPRVTLVRDLVNAAVLEQLRHHAILNEEVSSFARREN